MRRPTIRRPARGVFVEFLFGLLAGACFSLWLSSSSYFFSNNNNASSSSSFSSLPSPAAFVSVSEAADQPPADLPSAPSNVFGSVADGTPAALAQWRPKPRIPGHKTPKLLCLVTSSGASFNVDARVINATWGARCDSLYFTKQNDFYPSPSNLLSTDGGAGKRLSWEFWRPVFAHKYDTVEFDYLVVVEDKTYAVPDNVRYEFRGVSPGDEPLFWGRKKDGSGGGSGEVLPYAFVMSRSTAKCLQNALQSSSAKCSTGGSGGDRATDGPAALASCLKQECEVEARDDLDFQGKHQIMGDPFALLEKAEVPAHLLPEPACCSILPLAYMDVGRNVGVRTGTFSYLYYFDYFIRDTAVYGKEFMRPLNGIDAGVGKPQIGF